MADLKRSSSTRSTFTFRVAFDDIQTIQSELLEITSRIQENNKAIEKAQLILEKHSRESKSLDKKIVSRRKALNRLRAKSSGQLAGATKQGKKAVARAESASDLDITTNDVSIEVASAPHGSFKSPSPRKRKRYAGIWNVNNASFGSMEELDIAHVPKRARVAICNGEEAGGKENVSF